MKKERISSRKYLKVLFVDLGDVYLPTTWSGTSSQVFEYLSKNVDVILRHRLGAWPKVLFIPYILLCKLFGRKYQLDRQEMVARYYAKQVEVAFRRHKPNLVFSLSTIPLAYLPSDIPSVVWADAIFHGMIDFYWGKAVYDPWILRQVSV